MSSNFKVKSDEDQHKAELGYQDLSISYTTMIHMFLKLLFRDTHELKKEVHLNVKGL